MPPNSFDEGAFLWALASRPEDCRKFAQQFQPEYLSRAEYIPVLTEIYDFAKKHGEPPSLTTLHTLFKDRDEETYNLRYKNILNEIQESNPDRSLILYTLEQARDVSIVRSLEEMLKSQNFLKKEMNLDGTGVIKDLQHWLNKFSSTGTDKTMDIRKAIEHVVDTSGFMPKEIRIPTGIKVIDEWCGGGLRTKQLAIIMAPTGSGKSSVLIVIGHKIATIERKKVWCVTNELTLEQLTERFLARMTGKDLTSIINDPGIAYSGLTRHWKMGLDNRLKLTEFNREVSTDDIESEMNRWTNLIGWKPDVLVLDYMERMKPNDSGYRRDSEWTWYQAIARDLFRFAKRHNICIWTAVQTNRSGLHAGALNMGMAQGSVRHFQEATVVIGMHQVEHPTDPDKVLMEFSAQKMRESKKVPRPVTLECDLSKMDISNVQVDLLEEIESNETEDRDEEVKKSTPRQRQRSKKYNS